MADQFERAAKKQRQAQRAIDGVNTGKRGQALADPNADQSTKNADQARREGWQGR
jgi:hypothetical protein